MTGGVVGRWNVDRWRGPAVEAHEKSWASVTAPTIRLVEADGPALVLGSTQRREVVDTPAAEAAGVAVVRRRSGGGAVLVGSGALVWIDVFVPAGDRLWNNDVGRATHWLGQAWTGALASLGVGAEWHDGPLVSGAWSALVCFAGLGPGEVRARGAKVVGISQRRTRAGALFQSATLLAWDPAPTLAVLALDAADRSRARRDLAGVAAGIGDAATGGAPAREIGAAAVQDAFVAGVTAL